MLRDHGSITQQALSVTLEMDRTNMIGLLNELEAEGLILRRRSTEDRRRHVVELTKAGAKRLAEAECALAAADNEVLGALDDSSARRSTACSCRRRRATSSTAPPPPTAPLSPRIPSTSTADQSLSRAGAVDDMSKNLNIEERTGLCRKKPTLSESAMMSRYADIWR